MVTGKRVLSGFGEDPFLKGSRAGENSCLICIRDVERLAGEG